MALFATSDIKRYVPAEQTAGDHRSVPAMATDANDTYIIGRFGVDLRQLLPVIGKEQHFGIPCRGEWSLHQMLDYLLRVTGPAKVWLSSWGITEEPLKQVMRLRDQGLITAPPALLFDGRVKIQCPKAYAILLAADKSGAARIRLTRNHSKLLVLINDEWGVFVHTSANLTVNERLEYYMVSTVRRFAEWNRDWIELEMQDAHPFSAE